jgi:hypothetical protein
MVPLKKTQESANTTCIEKANIKKIKETPMREI